MGFQPCKRSLECSGRSTQLSWTSDRHRVVVSSSGHSKGLSGMGDSSRGLICVSSKQEVALWCSGSALASHGRGSYLRQVSLH